MDELTPEDLSSIGKIVDESLNPIHEQLDSIIIKMNKIKDFKLSEMNYSKIPFRIEYIKKHHISTIATVDGAFPHTKIVELTVAQAELKFLQCEPQEAMLFKGSLGFMIYDISLGLVKGLGQYLKPIVFSKIEIPKAGDWIIHDNDLCKVVRIDGEDVTVHEPNKYVGIFKLRDCYKVLSLPDNFSKETLHLVEKNELKEGKVYLECYRRGLNSDGNDADLTGGIIEGKNDYYCIKHNIIDQIIVHPVEEVTFTRTELREWAEKNKYTWGLYNGNNALPYEVFLRFLDNKG